MEEMILRLEQNETDYWELVAYFSLGRTVLKHHGEFRYYSDGVSYAKSRLTGVYKFYFDEAKDVK